jgi:hypothetical protein
MFDAVKIRAQIERAAVDDMELSPEDARDVAFHMTDWLDDLQRYARFCANPDDADPEAISSMLLAFLIHVPNHIAAAAKLYADMHVSDIFKVGATAPSEPATDD